MKVMGEEALIKLISLMESRYAVGQDLDGFVESKMSAYAQLDSPTFTGTPKAETAAVGTNTTQLATTAFVQKALSNLVNSAPATLDTLNELAAALGNDPNFATTISNQIGEKVSADSADYIKSAAVNDNTLTLTKGDNTTVVFTPAETEFTAAEIQLLWNNNIA